MPPKKTKNLRGKSKRPAPKRRAAAKPRSVSLLSKQGKALEARLEEVVNREIAEHRKVPQALRDQLLARLAGSLLPDKTNDESSESFEVTDGKSTPLTGSTKTKMTIALTTASGKAKLSESMKVKSGKETQPPPPPPPANKESPVVVKVSAVKDQPPTDTEETTEETEETEDSEETEETEESTETSADTSTNTSPTDTEGASFEESDSNNTTAPVAMVGAKGKVKTAQVQLVSKVTKTEKSTAATTTSSSKQVVVKSIAVTKTEKSTGKTTTAKGNEVSKSNKKA